MLLVKLRKTGEYLRRGYIEFHGAYYEIKNVKPMTFVEDVFLTVVFECEYRSDVTSIFITDDNEEEGGLNVTETSNDRRLNRAGIHLRNIAVKLKPAFEAKFYEDGQMVLEKMKGHIYSQDLGWTPLADHTVELKGGDTTIMIETGQLANGLEVRRIKSSATGSTIFCRCFTLEVT